MGKDKLRVLAAGRAAETRQRRRGEFAVLKEMAASLEVETVAEVCLDGVMDLLRPDAAWLLLPDGNGALDLVGSRGVSPEAAREPEAGFGSQASAPVHVKGDRHSGFLCVGAERARRFGPHELELLGMFASLAATAVQNGRLFASVARAKLEWERTFDSISDPILISDNDFRVVRLNRAAAACFEVPLKEAAGQVCYKVITGGRGGICPWHDALRGSRAVSSDRYLAHLDRWFSFSAFPFEDDEGNRIGVVHVLKDVTQDRKLREQMAHSMDGGNSLEHS